MPRATPPPKGNTNRYIPTHTVTCRYVPLPQATPKQKGHVAFFDPAHEAHARVEIFVERNAHDDAMKAMLVILSHYLKVNGPRGVTSGRMTHPAFGPAQRPRPQAAPGPSHP